MKTKRLALGKRQMPVSWLEEFTEIREQIERSYQYMKPNYDTYRKFMKMVFLTTISDDERVFLLSINRPLLEFNILKPYVSRLCGEFAKNEPDIMVSANDPDKADPELINFIENHTRQRIWEAQSTGVMYEAYRQCLAGGYTVLKVFVDYEHEMSMDEAIFIRNVSDPTLVGFDPFAVKPDKSDGMYFYECHPQNRDQFEQENPDVDMNAVQAASTFDNFQWNFRSQNENVVMLVEFYKKEKVKKKICLLSNGATMESAKYEKNAKRWRAVGGVPPTIVGERTTTLTKIIRYKLIGNQILEKEETDLHHFPYVFIAGDPTIVTGMDNGSVQFTCCPYVQQAAGAQKLKNFAGQSLAHAMEKIIQSPFMIAKDSVTGSQIEPWRNPQHANLLQYNAYKDDDVNKPLPPPMPIQPTPINPEINQTFQYADTVTQNILGSFDASMAKLTERQISGVAIQESMTLSNSSAMPYVTNFILGMQSVGQQIMNMIPLYYTTPRSVPVIDNEGNRKYMKINQQGGISVSYDPHAFDIRIEAGINFNIQQEKALNQLTTMAQAFPTVQQFVNEVGLTQLFDNANFRGVDEWKEMSKAYMKQQQEMKKQMMGQPTKEQLAMQTADKQIKLDAVLRAQKNQIEATKNKTDAMLKMAELENDKAENRISVLDIMADLYESNQKNETEAKFKNDELIVKAVELAVKSAHEQSVQADKRSEMTQKLSQKAVSKEV